MTPASHGHLGESEGIEQRSSRKKPVSISDTLEKTDEAIASYEGIRSVNQSQAASLHMSEHQTYARADRAGRSKGGLQVELPIGDRPLSRHGSKSNVSDDGEDVSQAIAIDDHSDYGASRSKPRRARKKQESIKPEATVESLRSDNEYLRRLLQEETTKNKDLRAKKAKIVKENSSRRSQQTTLKKDNKSLKEALQTERASSTKAQRAFDERNEGVKQIVEAHFTRRGKGATDALDDKQVQHMLHGVRMLWQNLVSDTAVASLEGTPKHYIEGLLKRAMPQSMSPVDTERLYQLFIKAQGAPRMLLGILVSHLLCETLFRDPFAFLEDAREGEKAGMNMVLDHGMLSKLQDTGLLDKWELNWRIGDEHLTQAWRHLTVKILNLKGSPASPDNHTETEDVAMAQVRELYYRRLATRILDEGSHLIKDFHDKSRTIYLEELMQMIRASGEVSALLWAQKAHMTPRKVDIGGRFSFSNDSPSIKAHPCMCLDRMDGQYNGRDVMLVIEPALFASGDVGDKTARVWMPAVGWFSHESPDGTKANALASPPEGTCDIAAETKRSQDVVSSQLERPTKRSKHGHLFDAESGPQEVKGTEAVDKINSSFSPIQEIRDPIDSRPALENPTPSVRKDGLLHQASLAHTTSEAPRSQDGQPKTPQDSHKTNLPTEGKNRAVKGGEEGDEMQVDGARQVTASHDGLRHIKGGTFEVSKQTSKLGGVMRDLIGVLTV